ncbi:hypothetical protein, partial [Klebsiella pneumoniae]|uniref:hypothetical protein n=1 Tax=Klebsiella pneumoniae TaxID=573 RepID=UPI0013D2A6AC
VQEKLLANAPTREHARLRDAIKDVTKQIKDHTAPITRDYQDIMPAILDMSTRGKLDQRTVRSYAQQGRFEETVCSL